MEKGDNDGEGPSCPNYLRLKRDLASMQQSLDDKMSKLKKRSPELNANIHAVLRDNKSLKQTLEDLSRKMSTILEAVPVTGRALESIVLRL